MLWNNEPFNGHRIFEATITNLTRNFISQCSVFWRARTEFGEAEICDCEVLIWLDFNVFFFLRRGPTIFSRFLGLALVLNFFFFSSMKYLLIKKIYLRNFMCSLMFNFLWKWRRTCIIVVWICMPLCMCVCSCVYSFALLFFYFISPYGIEW